MMPFEKGSFFGLIHNYLKVYLPKQRKVSPNTIRSYRESLDLLVDFIKHNKQIPLRDVALEMLTAETIIDFLDYLENVRGCSVSTRNNRLAAIRAFLKYATDMDVTSIVFFEAIGKIPMKKTDSAFVIDHMSEAAVAALIAAPDANTAKGLRNRFFMILMYDTGARIQEMLDIKLCNFRYGRHPMLTLNGKGGKVRTVPIMDKTAEHLSQYLATFHPQSQCDEQPLFYTIIHGRKNRISDDCVRKFLKQYGSLAKKSCPEVPENVHPHLLRHSRAMHLYQHGMDLTLVSQWLGHAQLTTTLVYAHADTEHKRRAIAAATSNGSEAPINISPNRFVVSDDETLKRLTGLR